MRELNLGEKGSSNEMTMHATYKAYTLCQIEGFVLSYWPVLIKS